MNYTDKKKEFKNPYLIHGGWKNKADEKKYNHEYYLRNKEKWDKYYKKQYKNHSDRDLISERTAEDIKSHGNALELSKLRQYERKNGQVDPDGDLYKEYERLANEKAKLAKDYGYGDELTEAIRYKKKATDMRKRRAASQMAENERQKYVANVKKQQAIHESKKQAIQKEYAKREKPLYKATRPFVTNWKIGANEIKRTASKGASFVKNLFK